MHKMILCIIEDVNNWDRIVMTAIKDSPSWRNGLENSLIIKT